MSIVAERPVCAQVGPSEWEKKSAVLHVGRVAEVRPGRGGRRSAAELDRARPVLTADVPERLIGGGFDSGPRVNLRRAVDVPLVGERRERLERLFVLHNERLVRYLRRRMDWADWQLAEDLVQEMWVHLTRPGQLEFLAQGGADEDVYPLLAYRARQEIGAHLRVRRNRERAAEPDPMDRDGVRGHLMEESAEPVAYEFTDVRFARAMAELPEPVRVVVHMRFELGMSYRAIGSRLELSQCAVDKRLKRGLALLRVVAEGGELVAPEPELPPGYEQVLCVLPEHYAVVVRLRAQGLSYSAIAQRVGGYSVGGVTKVGRKAIAALKAALRDVGRAQAPVAVKVRRQSAPASLPQGWEQVAHVLTEQQLAVACLRAQGLNGVQAAERLGISKSTANYTFATAVARLRAAQAVAS